LRGANNPRWNGGASEYPDHYLFKANRILVLRDVNGKCQKCGGAAQQVHHINHDKSDHRVENLMALCTQCHALFHLGSHGQGLCADRKAYARAYYQSHRERIRDYRRSRYVPHPRPKHARPFRQQETIKEKYGMTIQAMNRKTGISCSSIIRYLTCPRHCQPNTKRVMADFLGGVS
jgi:hypothetical protein